ncbi:MAG: GH32 C-terminal domain-containing protein [Sedimentisphaerales bacterium]|nr:GH32 C-terminal domain-containing protein [Sedimentisphaerales bacterium]
MKKWLICVLTALCGCAGVQRQASEPKRVDILIADFEGETYGDWRIEGEAFGPGPTKGTLGGQMEVSGFEGERLVNTYFKGDDTTGTLTSPEFQIQRKCINFLIGGGMYPGEACINLLVDGKVARTATGPNDRPGGTEALDWHSWDVSGLVGKTAQVEIVDNKKGGWGHINIDQIVQSDRRVVAEEVEQARKFVVKKRYLNLPVKMGARKRIFRLIVDDKVVRDFDIELADGEPDFWVVLDVSEWKGKEVTLKADSLGRVSKGLASVEQSDSIKDSKDLYKERLRPQFHFTSRRGWNNDSNGLVYYRGEYHLFYQHNPYGWPWGNMTWGHAVSTDLVHWKELGDAIHPDKLGTIFSGSAVIDEHNTGGFQTGKEKPIVCFYTSAGGRNPESKGQPFTQSIAYSNDRGRTWTKYEGNPVIGHIRGGNRDPKVIWHEPTKKWVMVLYIEESEMAFFTSDDLKTWERHSEIKSYHECPELFELAVDGDENNKKWILYGGSGDYLVGQFDGEKFTKESESIQFQRGNCFYASQTFNNIPEEDGRRIQIAWGRIAMPGMPFNQQMLFPVSLSLQTTDEGIRMFAEPVREIEKIHGRKRSWKAETLKPGQNLFSGIEGDLFHIIAEFSVGERGEFGFVIRGTPVVYNVEKNEISCKGKGSKLMPAEGRIRLEILVDRTSIEIFGNDGRVYMPIGGILAEDNKTLEIFTKAGSTVIESLEVYEVRSAW